MLESTVVELLRDMIWTTILLLLPPVGAALVVGVLIGLVQAITSVQEQTLSFVPKVLTVGLMFIIFGSWMAQLLVDYTSELLRNLPAYGAL